MSSSSSSSSSSTDPAPVATPRAMRKPDADRMLRPLLLAFVSAGVLALLGPSSAPGVVVGAPRPSGGRCEPCRRGRQRSWRRSRGVDRWLADHGQASRSCRPPAGRRRIGSGGRAVGSGADSVSVALDQRGGVTAAWISGVSSTGHDVLRAAHGALTGRWFGAPGGQRDDGEHGSPRGRTRSHGARRCGPTAPWTRAAAPASRGAPRGTVSAGAGCCTVPPPCGRPTLRWARPRPPSTRAGARTCRVAVTAACASRARAAAASERRWRCRADLC